MSRSYKHTPYAGDTKTKWAKRQANKLVRSKLERWNIQDNLTSGTYKVIFKLYDGNQLVDTDNEFVIVKKATP